MKRKFIKNIWFFLLPVLLLCSCSHNGVPVSSGIDSNENRKALGTDYMFMEDAGFYAYAPSILQADDNTRYVYYTVNRDKEKSASDVIAVRKGTLKNGEYIYEEKKIVLMPSDGKWDSQRVTCPSVIYGDFSYAGNSYTCLLAYSANRIEASKNFQIGLAVAKNPEGPFTKIGDSPAISYNSEISGSQYGVGNPSLVSYDKKGKVRIFYSHGDNNLSSTRVVDADLSQLDNPKFSGYLTVSYLGLPDDGLGYPLVANCDFSVNEDGSQLYMVKDGFPYALNEPKVATKLTVATMKTGGLYDPNGKWDTIVPEINQLDTYVDENRLGWSRMYSACILRDAYGIVKDTSKISICFTSSHEPANMNDTSYTFSPGLHMYEIKNS